MTNYPNICVALTGASGIAYGLRLLAALGQMPCTLSVLWTKAARITAAYELDLQVPGNCERCQKWLVDLLKIDGERLRVYAEQDWFAPIASGSGAAQAMVVVPCSMGSLAAIAQGHANNLLERAADVMIKECRPLIIVPRETPLSLIHLRNMTTLAESQVIILPANPGFYHKPQSMEDLVDFVVGKILDALKLTHNLQPQWGS